jgi:cytochrome P450
MIAAEKLQERQAMKEPSADRDLLQKFVDTKTLDSSATIGLLMSTISAAADTTATSTSATIFYLLKNPETLARLRAELKAAKISAPIPQYEEVKDLPYLNATIKEAMRLFPVLNWPMERRVPAGGALLAGTFFPEGTSVGCMPSAVHHNRTVFGDDVYAFRPERWLEGDAEALRKMEASHLGFSRGRRVCLGIEIARMQLKKIVSAIVLGFEVCSHFPSRLVCSLTDTFVYRLV